MRSAAAGALCLFAVVLSVLVVVAAAAQERSTPADPRVGLKAGLRDAGEAAKNLVRIASMPKPAGFFDPKAPGGEPTPPERERDPNAPAADPTAAGGNPPAAGGEAAAGANPNGPAFDPRLANRLGFANSDLAFSRNHVFMGSLHGFNTYDIDASNRPRLLASIVCPGGQGDVSIHGTLFMSVEQTRGRLDCGTEGVQTAVSAERFRGVRIFDISDVRKPKQIAAVQTCRGSHTHTLVIDPQDKDNIYVYGSGTSAVRSGEELSGCSSAKPEDDPNTSLFSIDVIQVPLAAPQNAHIVNKPRIFADVATGAIAGLSREAPAAPGMQPTRQTNQCHDITVYP